MSRLSILTGDCRDILPTLEAESVQCCVTSPPYWGLRDYGVNGALGLEATPQEYIANMVAVFREVWRVLRDDGTCWINLGDSYASGTQGRNDGGYDGNGSFHGQPRHNETKPLQRKPPLGLKPKDLCMMPARLAMALQADGWYLRSEIVWHKPNPIPESVTDRPTKAHEMIYLLAKQERYFYDAEAIREPQVDFERGNHEASLVGWANYNAAERLTHGKNKIGPVDRDGVQRSYNPLGRNKRSVWTIATQPYAEAHFATFPEEIPKLCILAGSKPGDTVLDPFAGSGTVGQVALEFGRRAVLIELNPAYIELAEDRTFVTPGFL
jgi:DNA modification methylase